MADSLSRWNRRARLAAGSRTRILIVLGIVLVAGLLRLWPESKRDEPSSPPPESELVVVERVVDGDTIVLADKTRVRLIGIDTPELAHDEQPTEPFGPEAAAWLSRELTGQPVRLEYDLERVDQYGRTLAFVYRGELLINAEIVRQGFSRAETRYPFSSEKKGRLLQAEREAREHSRGVWGLPEVQPERP